MPEKICDKDGKMIKRIAALLLLLLLLPQLVFAQEGFVYQEEEIPEELTLIPASESVFQVRGMRRLVNLSSQYSPELMDERIDNFNEVLDALTPHIPVYLYFAENSRTHPIQQQFSVDSEAYLYLKERLHTDGADHIKYGSFREFCNLFYATDHHWNYRGSYQAYVDIVRMLKGGREEVLEPAAVEVFPVYFNGFYSKELKLEFSREYFAIYRFDPFPKYTALVNGKKKVYDHFSNYLQNKFNNSPMYNHYAACYGGDYGMIVFQGEQTGKGTLLLIGDSLSNAVKTLLIHHYDRIVYVDLRHYEEDMGKPCSMSELMAEYPIDQILLLGNINLFTEGTLLQP